MKPLLQIFDHQMPFLFERLSAALSFHDCLHWHLLISVLGEQEPSGALGMEESHDHFQGSRHQAHTPVPHSKPHSDSAHPCWRRPDSSKRTDISVQNVSSMIVPLLRAMLISFVDKRSYHQTQYLTGPSSKFTRTSYISCFSPCQLENKLKKKKRTQNQKPNHIPLICIPKHTNGWSLT